MSSPLVVFARMVFVAPFVGLSALVVSALWMVPVALGAGAVAGEWRLAPLDAPVVDAIEGLLDLETALPDWIAPVSWLPVIAAILVWAFIAQRTAMRLADLPQAPRRLRALLTGFPEWLLLCVAIPGVGIGMLMGGALAVGVFEFSWPFGSYNPPSVPARLGAAVTGMDSMTLDAHAGPAFFALGPLVVIFVITGRLMALHAADVDGVGARRDGRSALLIAGLAHGALGFGVVAALGWIAAEIAGAPLATWQALALQLALLWCSLSVASAYATVEEVNLSLAEKPFEAFDTIDLGAMPDRDDLADDDLTQRLRDWQARRAA